MNNKARDRRRVVKWARYLNHYSHITNVICGGWAAMSAIGGPGWPYVRKHRKPYKRGYPR